MVRTLFLILSFSLAQSLSAQTLERYKQIHDTVVHSTYLGYEKNISITLPSEYQEDIADQQLPLIIIFDRQNNRSYNYMLNTIDYLTSNEQMPSSIIIGVESSQLARYKETQLEVNDSIAFGHLNEGFVFEELIPFAQQHYKASEFIVLVGHSRYGYFTTYLLKKRADELNAVISLSPFFTERNVNLVDSVTQLFSQTQINHHLYYRYGIGNDYPEDFQLMDKMLSLDKHQNNLLDFKGVLFEEADHNATPGLTIGSALYDVFSFWGHQQNIYINNDTKRLDTLKHLTENILSHYGKPLAFSLGTLNGKGWYFFNEGAYQKAIDAWEILLEAYPNFSEGYLYILYAQQELGLTITSTLAQLKKSLASTTFYSAAELQEIWDEINEIEK